MINLEINIIEFFYIIGGLTKINKNINNLESDVDFLYYSIVKLSQKLVNNSLYFVNKYKLNESKFEFLNSNITQFELLYSNWFNNQKEAKFLLTLEELKEFFKIFLNEI